jgi:hypothetical protein
MKDIPDCANAVRDLTCHLSNPGVEHWKALSRLIGYLKHHYRPMKLRAPKEMRVVAAFDSDWATDKNDRKSISSYVTTIGGTSLINWQSKKQATVALSTCEAETMAGTMCAQDVQFVNNLLKEILIEGPELPSYVYGDNASSLFLAQNNAVGQRTKHIDIRHRFMHGLVQDGTVELRHIRSDENISDINSKNTKVETHEKLSSKLYEGNILIDPKKFGGSHGKVSMNESTKEDIALVQCCGVVDPVMQSFIQFQLEGNQLQLAVEFQLEGVLDMHLLLSQSQKSVPDMHPWKFQDRQGTSNQTCSEQGDNTIYHHEELIIFICRVVRQCVCTVNQFLCGRKVQSGEAV